MDDKEKLKRLEIKFAKLEKELEEFKCTLKYAAEVSKKLYTPNHCGYFLLTFEKIFSNIKKIMRN